MNTNILSTFRVPLEDIIEKSLATSEGVDALVYILHSKLEKGILSPVDFSNQIENIDLIKGGKRAVIGEIRTYAGIKMEKTATGWVPVKSQKKSTKTENDVSPEEHDEIALHNQKKYYDNLFSGRTKPKGSEESEKHLDEAKKYLKEYTKHKDFAQRKRDKETKKPEHSEVVGYTKGSRWEDNTHLDSEPVIYNKKEEKLYVPDKGRAAFDSKPVIQKVVNEKYSFLPEKEKKQLVDYLHERNFHSKSMHESFEKILSDNKEKRDEQLLYELNNCKVAFPKEDSDEERNKNIDHLTELIKKDKEKSSKKD